MVLVQFKRGRELVYGLSDGKWIYPYELTKSERRLEQKTGWPRKLPNIYPIPPMAGADR